MGQVLQLPLRAAEVPGCQGARGGGRGRAWSRERRRWWLLWASCPGVGWVRLRAIEATFGDLAEAWQAPLEAFALLPGIGGAWLQRLAGFRGHWGPDPFGGSAPPASLRRLLASERRVLLPGDPTYPAAMAALERPPLALHWRGHGALWPLLARRQGVAIVGTRRPSRHGMAAAEALGAALARAGWPVVSGLAEGIDAAAHRGCLEAGGVPVAVLGTPLERVYPRHHGRLQREVAERGLLVSEQPAGAAVRPGHFAARNRLQVALAQAVVVVECPESSGALHSARLAWDSLLPLWVVPADAGRLSARGSNRLMTQGASALLEADDLIQQLGPGPHRRPPSAVRPGGRSSGSDAALLQVLEGGGACLEQLCRALDQPAPQVAARLLTLELAGLVQAEPGLRWRRI
ncbi:DNA-processing protein DprA [Cyanobium sp. NIES-981]|uniref:DNA-processing protein DprA n=1 Tax=Cyanobium sp. NIES-981 TaxID=1851505 RepID=UPI0015600EAD|nr:DNA-processing protein DprA [Cyanobium sp. NIES-981]